MVRARHVGGKTDLGGIITIKRVVLSETTVAQVMGLSLQNCAA